MDRDLAERIVKGVLDLSTPFGALDILSREIADPDERRVFRYALGHLMAETLGLLRPIVRQFPDLDPYPGTD
jgi:hypothetical protein